MIYSTKGSFYRKWLRRRPFSTALSEKGSSGASSNQKWSLDDILDVWHEPAFQELIMSDLQLRQKVRKFLRCREGQDLSARVQELSVRPEQLFLPQAQDPVIMDVPLDQVRFASHVSDDVIASMSASYQSKDVQLHQWCLDHKIAGKWRFRASVIVSAVFIHLYGVKYFDAVVSMTGNLFSVAYGLEEDIRYLGPCLAACLDDLQCSMAASRLRTQLCARSRFQPLFVYWTSTNLAWEFYFRCLCIVKALLTARRRNHRCNPLGRLSECACCGEVIKTSYETKGYICSRCHLVAYCCHEHQSDDWCNHTFFCKRLKAMETSHDGAASLKLTSFTQEERMIRAEALNLKRTSLSMQDMLVFIYVFAKVRCVFLASSFQGANVDDVHFVEETLLQGLLGEWSNEV